MCQESPVPVSLRISDALSFVPFYRQTPLPTFRSHTCGLPVKAAFTAKTSEAVIQNSKSQENGTSWKTTEVRAFAGGTKVTLTTFINSAKRVGSSIHCLPTRTCKRANERDGDVEPEVIGAMNLRLESTRTSFRNSRASSIRRFAELHEKRVSF